MLIKSKSKEETHAILRTLNNILIEKEVSREKRISFWKLVSENIYEKESSSTMMNLITSSLEDLVSFALMNIEQILREEKKQLERGGKDDAAGIFEQNNK